MRVWPRVTFYHRNTKTHFEDRQKRKTETPTWQVVRWKRPLPVETGLKGSTNLETHERNPTTLEIKRNPVKVQISGGVRSLCTPEETRTLAHQGIDILVLVVLQRGSVLITLTGSCSTNRVFIWWIGSNTGLRSRRPTQQPKIWNRSGGSLGLIGVRYSMVPRQGTYLGHQLRSEGTGVRSEVFQSWVTTDSDTNFGPVSVPNPSRFSSVVLLISSVHHFGWYLKSPHCTRRKFP